MLWNICDSSRYRTFNTYKRALLLQSLGFFLFVCFSVALEVNKETNAAFFVTEKPENTYRTTKYKN